MYTPLDHYDSDRMCLITPARSKNKVRGKPKPLPKNVQLYEPRPRIPKRSPKP